MVGEGNYLFSFRILKKARSVAQIIIPRVINFNRSACPFIFLCLQGVIDVLGLKGKPVS